MRAGVTLEDVTQAADQLLAGGERPTVEGVRKMLGTGSPATVNNLLKEYYAALPSRLNLPAAIASAAAALYQQIRDTALDEAKAADEERQQQAEAERERLATDRRQFEEERIRLRQQVAGLEVEKQSNLAQIVQVTTRAAGLERNLAEQTERAASAVSKAAAAVEERERSSQRHVQELQHVKDQAQGNERHLLSRIDEQATQLRRLTSDREKDSAANQQRIATLENAVSEGNKGQAALRNELAAAQRDLAQDREQQKNRDRAHSQEIERAARELQALTAERDRLRSESALSSASMKLLGQERDDALREAARLDGKLQSQMAQVDALRQDLASLRKTPSAGH